MWPSCEVYDYSHDSHTIIVKCDHCDFESPRKKHIIYILVELRNIKFYDFVFLRSVSKKVQ